MVTQPRSYDYTKPLLLFSYIPGICRSYLLYIVQLSTWMIYQTYIICYISLKILTWLVLLSWCDIEAFGKILSLKVSCCILSGPWQASFEGVCTCSLPVFCFSREHSFWCSLIGKGVPNSCVMLWAAFTELQKERKAIYDDLFCLSFIACTIPYQKTIRICYFCRFIYRTIHGAH